MLGETSKTYTVSPTDAGKRIKVKALFNNDAGNTIRKGRCEERRHGRGADPHPGRGGVCW